MVNLLGATLPDRKLLKIALLAFHGINHRTSSLIMARLSFHDQLRVQDLSELQLNSLSALLSSPTAAPRPSTPLLPFSFSSSSSASSSSASPTTPTALIQRTPPPIDSDPITSLILEEDLKRQTRSDIAHHKTIGTLTGRQHAMGLPVRGQRNKTNAKTAKRLNRLERRGYCTTAITASQISGIPSTRRSPILEALKGLHLSKSRPSI